MPPQPHAVNLGASGGRLRLRVRASPGSPGIAPAGVRAPLPAPPSDGSRHPPTGSPQIAPAARAQLDGGSASSGSGVLEARFTEAAAGGAVASLPHGTAAAAAAEARAVAAERAAAADRAALAAARAEAGRLESALQEAEGAVASLQRAVSRAQDAGDEALLDAHRQRERAEAATREAARATQEAHQLQLQLQLLQGAAQTVPAATAAGAAGPSSATTMSAEGYTDAAAKPPTALLAAAARRGQPIAWDVAMPRVIALPATRSPQRAGCGCGCGVGRCSRALTRLILRVLALALALSAAAVLALQWDAGSLTPRHVAAGLLQAQGRHPWVQRWIRLEAAGGCLYAAQRHRLPLCLSEADRAWVFAGGGQLFPAPVEASQEATIDAEQKSPAIANHRHATSSQKPDTPEDRSQSTAEPSAPPPPPPADPSSGDNQSDLAWAALDAAGGWSAGGAPLEPMPLASA